jgi:hypothetical protein
MTMLDTALDYAERHGFSLLPAPATGEKKPIGLGGPDFENATNDAAELQKHWLRHPNANIIRRVYGSLLIDVESEEGHPTEAKQARMEGKAFGIDALNELQKEKGRLPKTLIYNTWSGGLHLTYNRPAGSEDKKFKTKLAPGLELKSNGIVMLPPSVRDGKRYRMLDDVDVADLPGEWINFFVEKKPRIVRTKKAEAGGETICQRYGIDMFDVCVLPMDARQQSDEIIGSHPIHDSDTKTNFHVHSDGSVWHCERHHTGGDALTWVAVREGFIECENAGPLDRETVLRCIDVLRRDGLASETMAAIPKERRDSIDSLAQWLIMHPRQAIAFYRWLMDDYHQGEHDLKTSMWREIQRVAFHSTTALLHSDMTAPSRMGKTSLMLKFVQMLPPGHKEVLTSLSPKAIWYKTLRRVKKRVPRTDPKTGEDMTDPKTGEPLIKTIRVRESDPNYYVGKLIVILELSEMKDFGVLMMLADEYETGFTHETVIDQESVALKVEGPRCVMTMSVKGIQNDVARQILNRFIQTPLDEPTAKGTAEKLEMVTDHDLDESTIDEDPRLPVLQRMLEVSWSDGFNVAVKPPSDDVRRLMKAIDRQLHADGFNVTQIREFHTFALCAAFEKRFARGDPGIMQIQENDVREAWFILTTFGNFARGSLTRAEYDLLKAIPNNAEESEDASDLRERTGLGVATINDALRVKEDPVKGQGKFLQYGYVNYIQGTKASQFYRLREGDEAVKKITTEIEFDGEPVKPLNPCAYPYYDLLLELPDTTLFNIDSTLFGTIRKPTESQKDSGDAKK